MKKIEEKSNNIRKKGLQNLSKKLIKRSRKIWQIKNRCLNETIQYSNKNIPNNNGGTNDVVDKKCKFCGKSFPNNQAFNLKIHILKAHPPSKLGKLCLLLLNLYIIEKKFLREIDLFLSQMTETVYIPMKI